MPATLTPPEGYVLMLDGERYPEDIASLMAYNAWSERWFNIGTTQTERTIAELRAEGAWPRGRRVQFARPVTAAEMGPARSQPPAHIRKAVVQPLPLP